MAVPGVPETGGSQCPWETLPPGNSLPRPRPPPLPSLGKSPSCPETIAFLLPLPLFSHLREGLLVPPPRSPPSPARSPTGFIIPSVASGPWMVWDGEVLTPLHFLAILGKTTVVSATRTPSMHHHVFWKQHSGFSEKTPHHHHNLNSCSLGRENPTLKVQGRHVTQSWPIRSFPPSGLIDWLRDGNMTHVSPTGVTSVPLLGRKNLTFYWKGRWEEVSPGLPGAD